MACCCTPYGWNTLIGAAKILSLGKLLSMIWEWMPANFATWSFFEFTLLGLIGLGFYRGLSLSVPRIILLLGLLWMALSHSRNIEIFAFVRWSWPSRLPSSWERCARRWCPFGKGSRGRLS